AQMPPSVSILQGEWSDFHSEKDKSIIVTESLGKRTRGDWRFHLRPTTLTAAILHPIIIRPATALRRHPRDDLVRVHDVAGLAVDTVGWVQVDPLALGRIRGFFHLVDIGRAEVLAGIAELSDASGVADVGVMNHQVRWLIFFMLGAGMVKIGQLVERQFAVALRFAKQAGFL